MTHKLTLGGSLANRSSKWALSTTSEHWDSVILRHQRKLSSDRSFPLVTLSIQM